ncbi:MAG: amidohydrolase family protein [Gemmatimonadota bacterium]|nr:MAG: amidohydrolase family protein [Gemmatimonadota bacterium]
MRIRFVIKGSLLGAALGAVIGIAYAHSRGRFDGLPVDGPPIALVGARLYDPAGDSVVDPATVIIRGRTITAVGRGVALPDSARTFYLSGLTLLPGLIDSHVHLSGIRSRIADGSRELGWLRYFWRFSRRFPERRRAFINAGITSVKSLGDPYPWVFKLAARIDRHELGGPRIFAGGPYLTAVGGHPLPSLRRAGQGDTSFIAQIARQLVEPDEARSAVDGIARRADFISVVLEKGGDPQVPELPVQVLNAIAAAGARNRLPTLVHVDALQDVLIALAAGARGIEHLPLDQLIDPVTLAELREQRVFVDPTLQAVEQLASGHNGDVAAARTARRNLRRLLAAGVPVVAGSDAPSPGTTFGYTLHEELRNLVEAGYSPREAIASATTVAAEYLGVAEHVGTIAPGNWADIIAVGGDPLVDISATARVYLVVADGQILLDRLDEIPAATSVVALRDTARGRRAGPVSDYER